MVAGIDAVDALQVAHHEAGEVPALMQDAGQELLVAGGGNAVDGVVAGHHRKGAAVDGRLEGGQHILLQIPRADMGGTAVVAALGYAIGHKMLEGGDDALGGSPLHHGRCHPGGQVNVFSVGFFHAGPAGFAGQVYHRAVADGSALRRQFPADDAAHLFHELGVPGGAEAYRRGEDGGADGHVPVRGFLGQDDGNAQAGGIHGIALQGVVGPGGKPGIQAVLQGFAGPGIGPESGPEHASVLLLDEFSVLIRDADLAVRHFFIHGPAQRAQQLPQLFFHRHAGNQVVGPFGRRPGSVFVQRGGGMAGDQQRCRRCGSRETFQKGGKGKRVLHIVQRYIKFCAEMLIFGQNYRHDSGIPHQPGNGRPF